jgi:hypothetical protein
MLTVLSAIEFDPTGVVQIDALPASKLGDTARRVNRIATLDGGAVVNDFGFSDSDRTIDVAWSTGDAAFEAAIVRLVETYRDLQIATRHGVYRASPETYRVEPPRSTLRLLVTAKLSA